MAILKAETAVGIILGQPSDNQSVSVFKGIPFAKPPVGELRWKAPVRPEPFKQPYEAYTFGPIPYQYRVPAGSVTEKEFYPVQWPRSEDCLYLNVWTPAKSVGEKLPVAVWIFGGGFNRGYSNKQETGGDAFARRGCVYVEFNYRVGVFGFMAHKLLSEEAKYHASGNYGLLDQIAALKWVRENIAAFGGDPDRITIFGQSAGAMSALDLMTSPLSQNDFQQAILQSGGGLTPLAPDHAEADGEEFFKLCGVSTLREARALSTEEVFKQSQLFSARSGGSMVFRPHLDGYVLPEDPRDIIRSGKLPDFNVMIGHNRHEGSFTPAQPISPAKTVAEAERWIRENRGEYAQRILEIEKLSGEEDVAAYMTSNMQRLMMPGTYAFADKYSNSKPGKVHLYIFDHTPPGEPNVGVYHSAEKWYVFETILRNWRPMTADDYQLSMNMADYWANFIKTGDPNGPGLPQWPAYDPEHPAYMSLGLNSRPLPLEPDEKTAAYWALLREENANI